jgi:hypothetical protein
LSRFGYFIVAQRDLISQGPEERYRAQDTSYRPEPKQDAVPSWILHPESRILNRFFIYISRSFRRFHLKFFAVPTDPQYERFSL